MADFLTRQRQREVPSFICCVGNATLFVPSEKMEKVRNHSIDSAIATRAGIHSGTITKFRNRHPEMLAWIYRHCHCRSPHCRCGLPDGAQPSKAMAAARRQTSLQAIGRAAEVSIRAIGDWLEKYKHHFWFEGWLLRGESLPNGVTMIPPKAAQRYRRAWDYVQHCRYADLAFSSTYLRWLKEGLVPGLAWRKYLFGGQAPSGAFVIPPELERLWKESSLTAILEAANLDMVTLHGWQKNSLKHRALQEAINAANASGPKTPNPWSEETAKLSSRTKRNILRYAQAQTLSARLGRADFSRSYFESLRHQAERRGVREHFEKYQRHEEPYAGSTPRSGLVANNFFILSPAMRQFRKAASGHGVAWTTDFPDAYDHWFAEWTTPRSWHGNRIGDLSRELGPLTIPSLTREQKPLQPKASRDLPQQADRDTELLPEDQLSPPISFESGSERTSMSIQASPGSIAEQQPGPPHNLAEILSDRQRNLLGAMVTLKAFSFASRRTTKAIVKAAEGHEADPDNFKHDMSFLRRARLIETRVSRSGGAWLRPKGRKIVRK